MGDFLRAKLRCQYIPLKIGQLIVIVMKSINSMIASRYNEKHSNFIIAITKSIFITQISILYHYKGLETHILNILK